MNINEMRRAKLKPVPRSPVAPGPAPRKRAYAPRAYQPRTYSRPVYKTEYRPARKTYAPARQAQSGFMGIPMPSSPGATVGAYLGHGVQAVVKALTGFGDYQVRSNSLMSGKLGGDPPIIKNSRGNNTVVRHREYIADVFAATSFTSTVYSINPGLIGSFPWVSQQADSYEQYKFRGLVFEFKSMSSDAVLSTSASSALGTVIMSTQYNVLDQPFTDKRTMENYEFANSCKPSCSMLHPIECKASQTSISELYVRTGATNVGDQRLYDLANFSIAVQGMQGAAPTQVIGELWCTYELEFFKPKLLIGGGALLTDHFVGQGLALFTVAAPFGPVGTMVPRSGNNLGCQIQVPGVSPYGVNSIVFPPFVVDGFYEISYTLVGTLPHTNSPSYSASGTTVNIDVVSTSVRLLQNNANSYSVIPSPGVTGGLTFQVVQLVKVIQTNPGVPAGYAFLLTGGATQLGNQVLDLIITQLAPNIN